MVMPMTSLKTESVTIPPRIPDSGALLIATLLRMITRCILHSTLNSLGRSYFLPSLAHTRPTTVDKEKYDSTATDDLARLICVGADGATPLQALHSVFRKGQECIRQSLAKEHRVTLDWKFFLHSKLNNDTLHPR
jgi:hypothetical protein